jgi:hypothetical protein
MVLNASDSFCDENTLPNYTGAKVQTILAISCSALIGYQQIGNGTTAFGKQDITEPIVISHQ